MIQNTRRPIFYALLHPWRYSDPRGPYAKRPDYTQSDWATCYVEFHGNCSRVLLVPTDLAKFAPMDLTLDEFQARKDDYRIQHIRIGTRIATARRVDKVGGYTLVTTATYIEGGRTE